MLQTDRPVMQIAKELEIGKGTLHNGVSTLKLNNSGPSEALLTMEIAAVGEMETEIRRLQMANEFLKEAAVFFAETQPWQKKLRLLMHKRQILLSPGRARCLIFPGPPSMRCAGTSMALQPLAGANLQPSSLLHVMTLARHMHVGASLWF